MLPSPRAFAQLMYCGLLLSVAATVAGPASAQEGAGAAPPSRFAPEVYRERREKLMKGLGDGVAVLYSRGTEDRDGFLQDSDFHYLTGIDDPGAVLVLSPGERVYKEWLFLKARDQDEERWTGERADIGEGLRKSTGFDRILRTSRLDRRMVELLRNTHTLHQIHQADLDGAAPETALYGRLDAAIPGLSVKDATHLLPRLRSLKEPRELEYMERAIAATLSAHRAAARAIKANVQENWVEGLIGLEFKRAGAVRPAFSSIVGSGRNSTVLHYPKHDQVIAPGSLVVVDIGADYGHYAADVTRTYPADGAFGAEQRAIYEVVLRAQQAAMDMIRPGVYYEDLNRKAEQVIAEAGYRDYFIHGLGHFVGLDVHDAGLYSKPLEAGMVITVEPGIYIPQKALGVRIEDEVLVTPKGFRLLSGGVPRDPAGIEKLMRGQ
jgi:Xaa-Pro aminopeptidase